MSYLGPEALFDNLVVAGVLFGVGFGIPAGALAMIGLELLKGEAPKKRDLPEE